MGRASKAESERKAHEVDCEVNQSWPAIYQSIARRMLSCLGNSEAKKVSTTELKEQINIERILRQARSEKHKTLLQIFSRQEANETLVACMARWEEHLRMLTVLERECQELDEAVQNLSEKQELLATLMEGKMRMQKVAPEKYQEKIFDELRSWRSRRQEKHWSFWVKLDYERDRARMTQGMELSGAEGDSSGALDSSSWDSCSPSVAPDADDAMSAWSWTSPAKGKDRDWWSIDLEGEMEKLEVEGHVQDRRRIRGSQRAGGPLASSDNDYKGESEEPKGAENEKQESEIGVDEATLQEASVEVQSTNRKVIRVESEETQDSVRETLEISQEEADELGFVPSAVSEPRGASERCDSRCSEKATRYGQISSMVMKKKVVKPAQSICASCATMQNLCSRANSH